MQFDYEKVRETYLPAEEIAAIVAAGCPEVERGKDPAYYVMALVTKYVDTEIRHFVEAHLETSRVTTLVDIVIDLVATMMCHQHTASSKSPIDELEPIDESDHVAAINHVIEIINSARPHVDALRAQAAWVELRELAQVASDLIGDVFSQRETD